VHSLPSQVTPTSTGATAYGDAASPFNQLTYAVADWALHMVTAALKFSSSNNNTSSSYTTPDASRIDVLNILNWHEAHDEYEWPSFTNIGFDSAQAMRFRRAFVNDVFVALQKVGNIRITSEPGVLGTPQVVWLWETRGQVPTVSFTALFRAMFRVVYGRTQYVADAWPSPSANASARTAPISMLSQGRGLLRDRQVPRGDHAVLD
jgi:hypothetical protein